MAAPTQYDDAWKELRARERWVIFAFVGYMPIAGGLAIVVSRFTTHEWAVASAPLLWMAFFAGCCVRFQRFPCPRCGKAFYRRNSFSRGRECVNCGLSRYG